MARFDHLPGLPNRLHLTEDLVRALGHAVEAKTRCALLILDLDRFKAVNDTLGHPVADNLLAQVAARPKTMMGPSRTCGRIGGDELSVVLPDVQEAQEAEDPAHRINTNHGRPPVRPQPPPSASAKKPHQKRPK